MAKAGFNSKTPKIWLGLVSINSKNPTAAGCTRQGLFVNRTRSIESCDSFPLKQPCPCCVNKFIPTTAILWKSLAACASYHQTDV